MPILTYHMVDDKFDWGATRVTPKQFQQQIDLALLLGFTFHTLSDYLTYVDHTSKICLTFDDAYKSVYSFAFPILENNGIKATVFPIINYIDKKNTWDLNLGGVQFDHMSWEELDILDKSGWEIGSHTVTHKDCTIVSNEIIANELIESKEILESRFTNFNNCISYPFGNGNHNVAEIAHKCGYKSGVVLGSHFRNTTNPFLIPRIGVYLFDTKFSFKHKIEKKGEWWYNFLQKMIGFCSNLSVLVLLPKWIKTNQLNKNKS